jgi:Tol biopolymer transport system component
VRRAARAGLALALACAGGASCLALGVRRAELPAAPIAVRYYDPESARRNREEALAREAQAAGAGGAAALPTREGVARWDDLRRLLGEALGPGSGAAAPGPADRGFRREPDERSARLALLDPRSGEIELLPGARRGSVPVDWSPDRRRLLFTQIVLGYPQLFEYDRATSHVRPITREPGAHPGGCYGPEGRIVAASFDPTRSPPVQRLEISHPGGGGFEPLTGGPVDAQPACAPDGRAIAYIRGGPGGEGELVVRAPALGGQDRGLGPGVDPRFSPDGEFLVYAAPAGARGGTEGRRLWQLRRIHVSGLARASLGLGALDEREPSFSPDGGLIAYVGIDASHQRLLYVRRSDGSGDRLLFGDGEALGPVW